MNKADLISRIASGAEIPKAEAGKALDALVEAITEALKAGDKVTLVNFGTFAINERPARQGRNPRTGDSIEIAAKKVIKFKPGKTLTDALD